MSQQPNNQSDSQETFYLQEALRLSELQMAGQHDTFATIERKATLLITLYIAIIAYLLSSWTDESYSKWAMIPSFITISVLIIAAYLGISTLYLRKFYAAGAGPKYLMWGDFNRNFNKMGNDLLMRRKGFFAANANVLSEKLSCLESSLRWGKTGIILACIWVGFAFGYQFCLTLLPQVSDFLQGWFGAW